MGIIFLIVVVLGSGVPNSEKISQSDRWSHNREHFSLFHLVYLPLPANSSPLRLLSLQLLVIILWL